MALNSKKSNAQPDSLTLFLCGDVMTGRGIDQVLPRSVEPVLYESYVRDATRYVRLAEQANGPVPKPVSYDYIWGDALQVLEEVGPDLRFINLETSITTSIDHWPGKGVHYRMHPENVACLTAFGIDGCALANNHVLDWGYTGLAETLRSLQEAGIATAGAGEDLSEAVAPAVLKAGDEGRVLVFSYAFPTSGVPASWAAAVDKPGINYLPNLGSQSLQGIVTDIRRERRKGDIIVVSLHWGGNWGYNIPGSQRTFARGLIDEAAVDVVHGHSSHHVKGIEVYRERPIIYGCGDFINDYEGIGGHESFRAELGLMYFPTLDLSSGRLLAMRLAPMGIRQFRLHRANKSERRWLAGVLNREGEALGTSVTVTEEGMFLLTW